MKRRVVRAGFAALLTVSGCTTMTPEEKNTATGAAIGAAAGAGIAALANGNAGAGAAVGGVVGGASAYMLNAEEQRRQQNRHSSRF